MSRTFDRSFRLGLVGLICVTYYPALDHAPRADQWCYLIDTMQLHQPIEAIAHTYSYNRTRLTTPCDTDLFRPVLFVILALEKTLLEGDLAAIQFVGIMLHCGVCLLLQSLLCRIERVVQSSQSFVQPASATTSLLSYAITIFFALNPAIQELVIWAHLQGYLLFLVFLLGSTNLLLAHICGPRSGELRSPSLWGAWTLALVSSFTYELGQLYALLAGLFLAAAILPRKGVVRAVGMFLVFAAVPMIYQAVNINDLELHRGQYVPDNHPVSIRERTFTNDAIRNSARFGLYTVVQPFCPSLLQTSYKSERLNIAESLWNDPFLSQLDLTTTISGLTLGLFASFAILGSCVLFLQLNRLPILILLLFAGLWGMYSAANVLGRMNLQPRPDILAANSYYAYPALLFALTCAFGACQGTRCCSGYFPSSLCTGLILGLVALSIMSITQVRAANAKLAGRMEDVTRPTRAVNDFVRQHENEASFSLAIDYADSDPVPERFGRPVTDIVFSRWMTPSPKYHVIIRGNQVLLISTQLSNSPD